MKLPTKTLKEQEIRFMMGYMDEFKWFVNDAMKDGIHDDFEDHNAFLSACMEMFISDKEYEANSAEMDKIAENA